MSQQSRNEKGNASQGLPRGPQELKQVRQQRKQGSRQHDELGPSSQPGADDEVKIGEAGARTSISGVDGR